MLSPKMGRRFTTKIGVRGSPLFSAMAGRLTETPSKTRCSTWLPTVIAALHMTDVDMGVQVNPGMGTTWIPTLMTLPSLLKRLT